MATADHSKFQALSKKLIAKHGRSVTIRRKREVSSDTDKPWRGPDTETVSSLPSDHKVDGCFAVFIPAGTIGRFKDDVREFDRFLLAPTDTELVSSGIDIEEGDSLVSGGQVWGINRVHTSQPGDLVLLYELEVSL